MPLSAGKRLGSYEILATIGVGGMGEVYRARDIRLDRIVAIKVLADRMAGHPDLRERFEREAKAISRLTHPHICTLYDVGSDDGTEFLVMEYLDGETAAQRLASGPIPPQQLLRYGAEIAEALERAHRQGITHRDLKPANVMLTKAGAKLLDFGLAKFKPVAIERDAASAFTRATEITGSGVIVGTLQYMAPEQIEGATVDHRADIFALGATLYEMATGKKAFDGRSQASLIGAILRDEPRPISELEPLSPPLLDGIVATCLEKDPDNRWQSAGDIGRQLRLLQGSSPERVATRARRATLTRAPLVPWAIAAAAVLMAVALSTVVLLRAERSQPETRVEIVTPATSDPFSFALSPDGRKLAFVAGDATTKMLWLRSLDSATAQVLPETDGASYPFWSPDSASIGFFAGGKLKRIDVERGLPRVLADASEGRGGSWSDDGILFVPRPGSLQRVPATGGEVTVIGTGVMNFPQWLPDQRFIVHRGIVRESDDRPGIYLGSLDSADLSLLVPTASAARFMAPDWLHYLDGRTLLAQRFDLRRATLVGAPTVVTDAVGSAANLAASAFSVAPTGTVAYRTNTRIARQLVWFDRSGQSVGAIGTPDESGLRWPELSPEETRVTVERLTSGALTVWMLEVERGVLTLVAENVFGNAIWSPDGNRFAYLSNRSDARGIYIKDISNGADELVLAWNGEGGVGQGPSDWSRDGRFLAFTRFDTTSGNDLWLLPLDGDRTASPLLATRYDEDSAQFSPDGRWLAYRSTESGRPEVYLQAFPGPGPKVQVSTEGGSEPRWSADGAELFYMSLDGKLMAATVQVSAEPPRVSVPNMLFRVSRVQTGVETLAQYDVARDRRFLIAINAQIGPTEPISLLMNWSPARE
jgi:serine/threonine protein kinase